MAEMGDMHGRISVVWEKSKLNHYDHSYCEPPSCEECKVEHDAIDVSDCSACEAQEKTDECAYYTDEPDDRDPRIELVFYQTPHGSYVFEEVSRDTRTVNGRNVQVVTLREVDWHCIREIVEPMQQGRDYEIVDNDDGTSDLLWTDVRPLNECECCSGDEECSDEIAYQQQLQAEQDDSTEQSFEHWWAERQNTAQHEFDARKPHEPTYTPVPPIVQEAINCKTDEEVATLEEKMRQSLAKMMGVPADQIKVKHIWGDEEYHEDYRDPNYEQFDSNNI